MWTGRDSLEYGEWGRQGDSEKGTNSMGLHVEGAVRQAGGGI